MTNFEKVLKETQSEETFKMIASSEEAFRTWLKNLKTAVEEYGKFATDNNDGRNGCIPRSKRFPEN